MPCSKVAARFRKGSFMLTSVVLGRALFQLVQVRLARVPRGAGVDDAGGTFFRGLDEVKITARLRVEDHHLLCVVVTEYFRIDVDALVARGAFGRIDPGGLITVRIGRRRGSRGRLRCVAGGDAEAG